MPTDDADKIDYNALKSILDLEKTVIENIMKQSSKMDFIWTN